ncbi:hypothetical protein MTQ10_30615 [Streptomyces sp. XM83C]|uniref:DUF6059 family protein n=1 Tax=unclassified Streptomyces TaxID=2593676 RepID=UPI001FF9955E|nr:DUF6059 family protein [Streptomyces sp. XM83C]MCK1823810.1 hypothetical protein [Streptomyces sp. XM83C]
MTQPWAILTRVVVEAYRSLVAYGQMWIWVPSEPLLREPLERVRPDVPLSPVERALERQLLDLDWKV